MRPPDLGFQLGRQRDGTDYRSIFGKDLRGLDKIGRSKLQSRTSGRILVCQELLRSLLIRLFENQSNREPGILGFKVGEELPTR